MLHSIQKRREKAIKDLNGSSKAEKKYKFSQVHEKRNRVGEGGAGSRRHKTGGCKRKISRTNPLGGKGVG